MQDILQILCEHNVLPPQKTIEIRKICQRLNQSAVKTLLDMHIMTSEQIYLFFSQRMGYQNVPSIALEQSHNKSSIIPLEMAIYFQIFPVNNSDHGIAIGIEDPTDKTKTKALEFLLNKRIFCYVSNHREIRNQIQAIYKNH